MHFKPVALSSAIALALFGMVACGGGDDDNDSVSTPVAVGDTVALTASSRLISFNRAAPDTQVGSIAISGLTAGETLLGIDVRPADGKLYGLGSAGNLYTLEPSTGVATLKAALKAMTGDDNPFAALAGTSFAVDFNPVADRLRVVGNAGQNLRINVDTGDTITDGAITPSSVAVTAAAYTNSFAGTGTTQLFDLDVAAGRLHLQDPPNNGTVNAGVALGVSADAANGFDIDARTNTGYAVLKVGAETALYSINLGATSAAATRIGAVGGSETIRGIALGVAAAPTAIVLASNNRLLAFDPKAPNTVTSSIAVTGLAAAELLVGIDFRPRDGLLYGVSSTGRLHTIDPATGAATLRATLVADPADATAAFTAITGTVTSVDFNPAADRLRVITSDGQNLRIVVETTTTAGVTVTAGHTTTDGTINRAAGPAVVAASAYTNSFAGTTTTVLYNFEQVADLLTRQDPPNAGTLVDVNALGLDITGPVGFDIGGGDNGLVLAALRSGASGPFTLYTVSLTTGAATLYRNTSGNAALSQIGGAGGPANLIDLAIRF